MNIQDYNNVTDRIEISDKCRNEVLNMNKNKKIKHKMNKKVFGVLIAATVTVCGGTAVFAAEKIGVFDKLSTNQKRTVVYENGYEGPIDKSDKNNYDSIGQHAVELEEPEKADSEILSVQAESVYCDGSSLIIGISGSLADGNAQNLELIDFGTDITINGETFSKSQAFDENCNFVRFTSELYQDVNTQNSFSGSIILSFKDDFKIEESTRAEIKIHDIVLGDTVDTESEIDFAVRVVPDLSLVNDCYAGASENGYAAKVYEITPAMMTVGSKYPENLKLTGEQLKALGDGAIPSCSIVDLWYDDQGNEIEGLYWTQELDRGDGYRVILLQPTETEYITVKFFNKQQRDENGDMQLMQELTIELP